MKRPRDIEWPLPPATGASASGVKGLGLYDRIYDVVVLIPRGRVGTYGQIAAIVGRCTPRMAGYAMAAVPLFVRIPWQRVINSRGCVSPRRHGEGHDDQRRLLEGEGIVFDGRGRTDLKRFGWPGPTPARLARLEGKWKRRPAP